MTYTVYDGNYLNWKNTPAMASLQKIDILKAVTKAVHARFPGVPVVPSWSLGDDPATYAYPVLVKAAAGGGGKGMRVVRTREEFAAALEGARREAKSSFGDERVLVERYLEQPRHIEVQVFGDGQGNVLHLLSPPI